VRSNYSAAWHERLADGEVDSSVHTPAFTTRWDNYWIEGILWLVKNLDIDGIYLDGAPYERSVLRRLRAALEPITANRPNPFLLDLHASCFGHPHLPYAELYPFIDSIWYGEQCNYIGYSPEQWLAEVSGVPFGLQGQMLGDNRDQWHGLVFGMTCRIYPDPHRCNPRPLWNALDALGMRSPRMLGWWDKAVPLIAEPSQHVKATLFIGSLHGKPTYAVALANWAHQAVEANINFDYAALTALGLADTDATKLQMMAPAIEGFQPRRLFASDANFAMQPKNGGMGQGWLLQLRVTQL